MLLEMILSIIFSKEMRQAEGGVIALFAASEFQISGT